MFDKRYTFLCCTALVGALLSATPARALVVFDPTNFSQNVLTAAHTLEQINNQIRSLQNESVMLTNMAKNLETMDYSSINQMTGTLNRISSLMTQADSLSFDLNRLEGEWQEQYPDTYGSGISSNDMAGSARIRWQNAMGAYRQTMQVQSQIVENVQSDQSVLSDLVNQSQSAEGTLQAQQAANQLVALSAKQQMQIQSMMAVQYRAEAEDAARKAQAEEAARVATKEFLGTSSAYSGG